MFFFPGCWGLEIKLLFMKKQLIVHVEDTLVNKMILQSQKIWQTKPIDTCIFENPIATLVSSFQIYRLNPLSIFKKNILFLSNYIDNRLQFIFHTSKYAITKQKVTNLRRGPIRLVSPGGGGGNAKSLHGLVKAATELEESLIAEALKRLSQPVLSLHT